MKWLSQFPRTLDSRGALSAAIGLAFIVPLLAGLPAGLKVPQIFDVGFVVFPALFLSAVLAMVVLVQIGRIQSEAAAAHALFAACIASVVSVVVAWSGIWNRTGEVNAYTPAEALHSLFTLGIFPNGPSPLVLGLLDLIRFFPIAFAVVACIVLVRRKVPMLRSLVAGMGVYLGIAFTLNMLSWIAALLSIGNPIAISAPGQVLRTLINAQLDGYWTSGQSERFFALFGQQVGVSLAMTRAAIEFLVAVVGIIFLSITKIPLSILLKRLLSERSTLQAVVLLVGLAVGMTVRHPQLSYTDLLAFLIFAIVGGSWILWFRFRRDLENLPQDERERPSLPLPSGTIAPHELEQVCTVLLFLSIYGSFLLGWPVCIGFLAATGAAWWMSTTGGGLRAGIITNAISSCVIAASLGISGLAFGVRNLPPTPAMTRLMLTSALLIALMRLNRSMRDELVSRPLVVLLSSVGALFALLISGSAAMVALTLLFIPLLLWVTRSPGATARYGAYPFYGLLGAIILLSLLFPKALGF